MYNCRSLSTYGPHMPVNLTLTRVRMFGFLAMLMLMALPGPSVGKSWFEITHLVEGESKDVRKFVFGIITDLDELSPELKVKQGRFKPTGDLVAYLREGILTLTKTGDEQRPFNVSLELDTGNVHEIRTKEIHGRLANNGRGMELSTLTIFNDKLYSCDDKTGVVYELTVTGPQKILPTPWAILSDGNFVGPKEFKCEWSTVKDGHLIIGGHGGPGPGSKFIKVITPEGAVTSENWIPGFTKISDALEVHFPGYVTHEAIAWSDVLDKWVILPRKISHISYVEKMYEVSGTNKFITADDDFEDIQVKEIGEVVPTHGFSGFAFVPTTDDSVILALKSLEVGAKGETYIMAFDNSGNILFPETKFAAQKYEAIEFLREID